METDRNLIQLILDYELNLLDGRFCSCPENLEKRLSESVTEYGRSGRVYKRAEIIEALKKPSVLRTAIAQFQVQMLSREVLLANYVSDQGGEKALRTSVWVLEQNEWKLRFHQGTPCK